MNIKTDIKPVSYLKSKAADILKYINDTHRPVIITQNGEPRAVLQDQECYENMRNAIGILKLLSSGEDDLKNGKIKLQVDDLYHSPRLCQIIPELYDQDITQYREMIIKPWRIMYRIADSKVYILSVLDSRQNIEDVLLKRFTRNIF